MRRACGLRRDHFRDLDNYLNRENAARARGFVKGGLQAQRESDPAERSLTAAPSVQLLGSGAPTFLPPSGPEELGEQLARLGRKHSALDLGAMVEARVSDHVED